MGKRDCRYCEGQRVAPAIGGIGTSVKLSRWDSVEYLKTDADINEYLEAILAEGGDDPAHVVHALGVIARAKNMRQLARGSGISREWVYKPLSEEGNPTFSTVVKITKALGCKLSSKRQSSYAH